ncbi:MAG: hypothetical protein ACRD1Y_13055 [Terriglobales bacterium]
MMRNVLIAVGLLAMSLSAQQFFGQGAYNPAEFGQWLVSVSGQPVAAGSATIDVPVGSMAIPGGPAFEPLSTNVPIQVEDGSASETITPSAVSCTAGICAVTAMFAHAHPGNYVLSSADGGLQEAVNWTDSHGGGLVVVGPDYTGTTAITALSGGSTNTLVEDVRGGAAQYYTWRGSNYGQMFAVQGTSVLISGNNVASLGCSGVSAAMVAGTVTVNAGCVYGSRPILLTEATKGGTQGTLSYTESSGQIVITSSSSTDTSTVAWTQN